MAKETPTALPHGILPDVSKSKSDFDLSGSASASEAEFRATGRDGVTFDSAGLKARQYRPIETYEGIHRFDPDFDWEPEEERKVVRKVRRSKSYSLVTRISQADRN